MSAPRPRRFRTIACLTLSLLLATPALAVEFLIDQDASAVMATGSIGGEPFTAQAPGSLMTPLQGEIVADVTASTIEFDGSTLVFLVDQPLSSTFRPNFTTAQLAAEATSFGLTVFLAIRDLFTSWDSAPLDTFPSSPGVREIQANGVEVLVQGGSAEVEPPGGVPIFADLTSTTTPLMFTSPATITETPSGRVLTLPFAFELRPATGIIPTTITFQGVIVANEIVQAATCDVDGDAQFDLADVFELVRNRFMPATPPLDSLDADGDGILTNADLRACIPLCADEDCTRFATAISSFLVRGVR